MGRRKACSSVSVRSVSSIPIVAIGTMLLLGVSKHAAGQCSVEQLSAPLPGAGDEFGTSMDLAGDELVVGSRYSATVFVRLNPGTPLDATDDAWVEQTNLLGQHPFDDFGAAVALDGDHLLVGAPDWGESFVTVGRAYVFSRVDRGTPGDRSDDSWSEQAVFGPPTSETFALFGSAVALDGARLAIGAPFANLAPGGPFTGLVHVSRLDDRATHDVSDDQWVTEAVIGPGEGGTFFGTDLHLSGEDLLVTGRSPDAKQHVFHYRLDDAGTPEDPRDDGWILHGDIPPPSGAESGFGQSIARSGDTLILGGDEKAFEYALVPGPPDIWELREVVAPSDGNPGDGFGGAISIQGDRVLIGARNHGPFVDGAAYLFQRSGTQWIEFAKLTSMAGSSADDFGHSVQLASDTAFVGESGHFQFLTAGDSISGSVAIFAMAQTPWTFIDAGLPGANVPPPCLLVAGETIPDEPVVLTIESAPPFATTALVLGAKAANVPFKGGVLVPFPGHIVWLPIGAGGKVGLTGRWPSNLPEVEVYLQAWILDASGPAGFVSTNAVSNGPAFATGGVQ